MKGRGTKVRALAICLSVITALAALPIRLAAQELRGVTLAQAVTQALQANLTLRAAAFEVQITRAQLAQAQAAKTGTLVGTASYTRTSERAGMTIVIPANAFGPGNPPTATSFNLPPTPPDLFDARVTYEYPLYSGGRLEAQIALARAGVRGAEAALERVKQDIILATKQAYFQVLVSQQGVEVAQRSQVQAEETLRTAEARVRAGTSPRFDEIQAEVSVANARQSLVRARNGVATATQELAAVMGLQVDAPVRPTEPMQFAALRVSVPELVDRSLTQRPELVEHQARVDGARAAIELARAGGQPAVGLVGAGLGTGNSSTSISLGWSITLAATIPLFDGGVIRERIREAELRLGQLTVTGAQLRQRIELEVRRNALNLAAAQEELATAGKTVEQAREAVRLAQLRFREGVGTNLEVIAAQAALAQAEGAQVQALFAFNTARAQLERAAGGPI